MKKCVPPCFSSKKTLSRSTNPPAVSPTDKPVICGGCSTTQSVARDATVFVCTKCHLVNRLDGDLTLTAAPPTSPIKLRRITSSTFQAVSDDFLIDGPITVSESTQIPLCSVCMDAPGDMVFLGCNHGGFCEACARHIAANQAVGGSHCPRCRGGIDRIARIVKVDRRGICTAVGVEISGIEKRKQPPRVPPPVGLNKNKKR